MGNFFFFVIALIVLAIVTFFILKQVKRKREFGYMASRCSKYVRGTVKQIRYSDRNTFVPVFSIVDEGSVYELPYYRKTAENEFVVGRDYDLFVDTEELMIAMTDSDRKRSEDNTDLYLLLFIAVFTIASILMVILQTRNPDLSKYLGIIIGGGSFYGVAEILDRQRKANRELTSYITDATVVDYSISHDEDGSNIYYPVYAYYYGGVKYTATSNTSQSNREEFRRGQTIQIRLDPNDPGNSTILAMAKREYSILRIFKLLGFVLVVIGLALMGMSIAD
ncbi:MAG: DUF3592 domain-containing protein [Erysipelotrichaceae bacterium]|nr:DUF3592 domain-containing protein [Erysipelotrichaceae bacterium]